MTVSAPRWSLQQHRLRN